MNYDEMEAGTEMDRLIAEKVMGWQMGLGPATVTKWWRRPGAEPPKQFARPVTAWVPSSDIANAWEVVAHLRNSHWIDIQDMRAHYDVTIRRSVDERNPSCAVGDTAPLAICRAALKAVQP